MHAVYLVSACSRRGHSSRDVNAVGSAAYAAATPASNDVAAWT